MSRIEEAQAALSAAIGRLETALSRQPAVGAVAARDRRIAELERELDRLGQEQTGLETMVDQVAARLDGAIDRLKTSMQG